MYLTPSANTLTNAHSGTKEPVGNGATSEKYLLDQSAMVCGYVGRSQADEKNSGTAIETPVQPLARSTFSAEMSTFGAVTYPNYGKDLRFAATH